MSGRSCKTHILRKDMNLSNLFCGDQQPHVRNAESETTHFTQYSSDLRQRKSKSGQISSLKKKMVGSGTGNTLGHDLVDLRMELLELDSEDETSEESDTKRLISSVVPNVEKPENQDYDVSEITDESVLSSFIQMFIPFLLAGFGMVAASLLLDVVQHWPVYQELSEVYILVPALLGLKGNLEMTLASRLSTQANLGRMDTKHQQWSLIVGNLALIQCQAMVVALLASLAAVILGWVPEAHFDIHHGLVLCASALLTASIASFLLGLVMVAVILLSRRMRINPDNVATPIAASLGDLTTLALLSWIASLLYNAIVGNATWIAPTLIVICILATPIWGYIAAKNPFTKEVLNHGWTPVISAMLISSVGGLILDYTISSYKGIAVFQLVINGVGGNLVAVQASRISTALYQQQSSGAQVIPTICISPHRVFFAAGGHARTARLLLMMVIPGHLIFTYTISCLQAGHTSFTLIFMIIYMVAAILQVILLLYIAQLMVVWMWTRGMDPDSSAIPYLTAAGDLIGTALLGIAFHILDAIGDGDSDVGD